MWEMLTNKAKYGLRAMCALAMLPHNTLTFSFS